MSQHEFQPKSTKWCTSPQPKELMTNSGAYSKPIAYCIHPAMSKPATTSEPAAASEPAANLCPNLEFYEFISNFPLVSPGLATKFLARRSRGHALRSTTCILIFWGWGLGLNLTGPDVHSQ